LKSGTDRSYTAHNFRRGNVPVYEHIRSAVRCIVLLIDML
jgi:hypothetical protein